MEQPPTPPITFLMVRPLDSSNRVYNVKIFTAIKPLFSVITKSFFAFKTRKRCEITSVLHIFWLLYSIQSNFTFKLTRTVKVAIASETCQTCTEIISVSIGTAGILMTNTRTFHAFIRI
jgi:hypothetical protein